MRPIHHATVKRAARLGCTLISLDTGFRLCRTEDSTLSIDTFDSTAEALEAMERNEVEFETEETGGFRFACGVMAKSYHDAYSNNPHGPGCGDTVDVAMRDAVLIVHDGEKEPRVHLPTLVAIGTDAGLWKPSWESLNPGMQRMNLSNRIRGLLRNDKDAVVRIGSKTGRFGVTYAPAAKSRKKVAA